MSDNPCPPAEAVLLMLQERAHELGEEIQTHQRNLELATARREELRLLIAQLGRKPRARKASGRACADGARTLNETEPKEQPNQQPDTMGVLAVDGAIRSIFAPPSGAIVEAE